MAMIEAKFPYSSAVDGEFVDGYMDGVWSPFHFIIVVDAFPIAARVLEAFAAHVDEQVIADGMLQADWSGALRCMALLSSHRGASPPSTSRY